MGKPRGKGGVFGAGRSMSYSIFSKMKANDHHSGDSIKAIGRKEVRQMGRDLRQFVRRYTTAMERSKRDVYGECPVRDFDDSGARRDIGEGGTGR